MRAWELPADLRSAGEARRQVRWLLSGGAWDDAVDDVDEAYAEIVRNTDGMPDPEDVVEGDAVPRDPYLERLADVERAVDGIGERIGGLEDVVGQANVEREDARSRLRRIEDAVEGADTVVGFDDEEFVELVLMVAQSDYGGSGKKKRMLSTVLGVDPDDGRLFSRVLKAAGDTEDAADNDDTEG